jgi:TldD protein
LHKPSFAAKQRFFFDHYGVTENDLEHYLAAALSAGGDYADLYFEYLSSTSLSVDESMVKSASQGISAGCGVRVVSGERTGYAYTDDLSPQRILHAARTAALIANAPAKSTVAGFQQKPARSLYPVALPSVDADITAKVELLMRADQTARGYDPRIKEVRASYADELRTILIVGSDGTFAEDSQPLARVNVSCIAKTDASSGRGTSGGGGRVALDFFFGDKTPNSLPKRQRGRQFCNWTHAKLQQATWKWCSVRDGPAFYSTKPLATGWRLTSIAKRHRHLLA